MIIFCLSKLTFLEGKKRMRNTETAKRSHQTFIKSTSGIIKIFMTLTTAKKLGEKMEFNFDKNKYCI